MSQDGRGQVIPKKIRGSGPITAKAECGGILYASARSRYQKCSLGHVHCTRCRRVAHRFKLGWTCGPNCKGTE